MKKLLLLILLCAGCHTVEITTPGGYTYKSSQPIFAKKAIKSVSLTHQDDGGVTFNMEGYNSDMATGYVEAVKVMSEALIKATVPIP